jgi:hypothetical protein
VPSTYFSDRELGLPSQVRQDVDVAAWGGFVALINGLIANGAFGIDFPEECPDGCGPTGTNEPTLGLAVRGEIPELEWPIRAEVLPPTMAVMDLLEFCHDHVADAIPGSHHSFFNHYHLTFNRVTGQEQFRERVYRILSRNRLAYEINENGTISRLAAPILRETLASQVFDSGDKKLDALLESARCKFLAPDSVVRREALEKLWDAWERAKTLESDDKRKSAKALLDKAATEPRFRELLEAEAKDLTDIGNGFHIRHSETTQTEIMRPTSMSVLPMRHGGWKNARRTWWPNEPSDRRRHEPVRGLDTTARTGRLDGGPLVRHRRSPGGRCDHHGLGIRSPAYGLYARSGFWERVGADARG